MVIAPTTASAFPALRPFLLRGSNSHKVPLTESKFGLHKIAIFVNVAAPGAGYFISDKF